MSLSQAAAFGFLLLIPEPIVVVGLGE